MGESRGGRRSGMMGGRSECRGYQVSLVSLSHAFLADLSAYRPINVLISIKISISQLECIFIFYNTPGVYIPMC